jgi:hypothetical protein
MVSCLLTPLLDSFNSGWLFEIGLGDEERVHESNYITFSVFNTIPYRTNDLTDYKVERSGGLDKLRIPPGIFFICYLSAEQRISLSYHSTDYYWCRESSDELQGYIAQAAARVSQTAAVLDMLN